MRSWLVVTLCLGLTSAATAQPGVPEKIPIAPLPTKTPTGASTTPPTAQTAAPGAAGGGKMICVPEPATRIKVSIAYSSVEEKFCYPSSRWSILNLFGCGDCGCGPVYTKKVLVKKFVETPEPYNKCVPRPVPWATNQTIPPVVTAPPETIPIAPVPVPLPPKKGN